jgi:hypothetical protein
VADRRPPFQLAPVRARACPHAEADAVLHEVTHDLAGGAEPLELVEDQADDGLSLLIGVERELAGRQLDVADRGDGEEFAPARLVVSAVVHPPLQDVQLRLAHDAGEPQQQAVVVVGVLERAGITVFPDVTFFEAGPPSRPMVPEEVLPL